MRDGVVLGKLTVEGQVPGERGWDLDGPTRSGTWTGALAWSQVGLVKWLRSA